MLIPYSSSVVLPRRLEMDSIPTACSFSGPLASRSASYLWIRPFCVVDLARAPRFIHSSSTRRMDCRLRWAACYRSSCWVKMARY